ncbi:MAG: hypothetical protein AAF368_08205 [Planctomycetota bacterium]
MNPILNETAHGILDYATVLAFLAAPSLVALDHLKEKSCSYIVQT